MWPSCLYKSFVIGHKGNSCKSLWLTIYLCDDYFSNLCKATSSGHFSLLCMKSWRCDSFSNSVILWSSQECYPCKNWEMAVHVRMVWDSYKSLCRVGRSIWFLNFSLWISCQFIYPVCFSKVYNFFTSFQSLPLVLLPWMHTKHKWMRSTLEVRYS